MNHKIYCKDCNQYFRLYVKSEKLVNGELIQNMIQQAVIFGVLSLAIYGVYRLDMFLKIRLDSKYDGSNYEFWILETVLFFIMIWCTYLRFNITFMKRKKLIWVEVQDYLNPEQHVTRNEAKRNLRFVYEKTET
jgi:hypothetical protein